MLEPCFLDGWLQVHEMHKLLHKSYWFSAILTWFPALAFEQARAVNDSVEETMDWMDVKNWYTELALVIPMFGKWRDMGHLFEPLLILLAVILRLFITAVKTWNWTKGLLENPLVSVVITRLKYTGGFLKQL